MSKFKAGDIVVVVKRGLHERDFPLGEKFEIDHVNIFNSEIYYAKVFAGFVMEDEIEFAEIYNTPLYLALT